MLYTEKLRRLYPGLIIFFIYLITTNIRANNKIEKIIIKPVTVVQVADVKHMIVQCAYDLWQPNSTLEQYATRWDFDDLENLEKNFFNNKGTFLVLLDGNKVVGSGGIKKIDEETGELIRLWFLKEYRGKGLGFKMAYQLLEFARKQGYKKVCLDVYYPELQKPAISLYKKLGFYEIEPYNNCPAKLWMEKIL